MEILVQPYFEVLGGISGVLPLLLQLRLNKVLLLALKKRSACSSCAALPQHLVSLLQHFNRVNKVISSPVSRFSGADAFLHLALEELIESSIVSSFCTVSLKVIIPGG